MSDVKVKFGAEDENLTSTLNKVQKELKQVETQSKETNDKFGMSFKGMAVAAAGVAVGIGAIKLAFNAVQGAVASFGEALDMGGRLNDLSSRTGESAGNLLVLERAFDNAGAGADKVGGAVNKLQKFMAAASVGGQEQTSVMTRLGVSMADLAGKTPTEQMGLFAKGIDGIASPTERADLAMKLFGKSGGELLPVLRNFSDELANARGELGSMPGIMNNYNGVFDTVSDKLQVISGKMTEFAAGVLSKVMPALELVTTAIANFDAAGFGARLAGAFIGGESAMKGFSAALAAFKVGNFSDMFNIAFASIILQVKQTANEIYRNFVAGIEASAGFVVKALGPSSGAFFAVELMFKNLGNVIGISVGNALAGILDSTGILGAKMAAGIRENMKIMSREIDINKDMINVAVGRIGEDFKIAGKAFPQSFKDAYASTKPLIAVEGDLAKVAELSKKYASDAGARAADLVFAHVFAEQEAREAELEKLKLMDEVAAKKQSEIEMEIAINLAKASGNESEVKRLEGIKLYNKTLEDALNKEIDLATATRLAVSAQAAHTVTAQATKNELIKIKTVAELLAAIDVAAPMKTYTQKIKQARADLKALKDFVGGDFSRMSVPDIAKKLGIDTAKKTSKELLDEIQKHMDDIKDRPVDININKKDTKEQLQIIEKNIADLGVDKTITLDANSSIEGIRSELSKPIKVNLEQSGSDSGTSVMESIKIAVEAIKTLVAKIEPKLPTAALGI